MSKEVDGMSEITASELQQRLTEGTLNLIDIREPDEFAVGHIAAAKNIPMAQLLQDRSLDPTETYYLICRTGARTAIATQLLQMQGLNIVNVADGIVSWPGALTAPGKILQRGE